MAAPFKFTDFILLLISASFKIAASKINFDEASILLALKNASSSHDEIMYEVLEFETEFYIGICLGTLFSAVFFMVVFKKKIYLLIVFFNSVSIIVEIFKITLIFLDGIA